MRSAGVGEPGPAGDAVQCPGSATCFDTVDGHYCECAPGFEMVNGMCTGLPPHNHIGMPVQKGQHLCSSPSGRGYEFFILNCLGILRLEQAFTKTTGIPSVLSRNLGTDWHQAGISSRKVAEKQTVRTWHPSLGSLTGDSEPILGTKVPEVRNFLLALCAEKSCSFLTFFFYQLLPLLLSPPPDSDECTLGVFVCASGATCVNTVGFYNCTCPDGYFGDGRTFCVGVPPVFL